MLTPDRLRELIDYDPATGIFTWKERDANFSNRIAGKTAGWIHTHPASPDYLKIEVDGGTYYAHSLAFLYMTGEMPVNQVDHLNQMSLDNRWENLRDATAEQNSKNRPMRSDNKSGVTGVWRTGSGKYRYWQAQINVDRKALTVYHGKSLQDAVSARKAAMKIHGYSDLHGLPK